MNITMSEFTLPDKVLVEKEDGLKIYWLANAFTDSSKAKIEIDGLIMKYMADIVTNSLSDVTHKCVLTLTNKNRNKIFNEQFLILISETFNDLRKIITDRKIRDVSIQVHICPDEYIHDVCDNAKVIIGYESSDEITDKLNILYEIEPTPTIFYKIK